ncbi:phosphate ABC transporter ATP-binding protein, partial [Methylobacterium radiotolerans]
VKDLNVYYGDFRAVEGVTMNIEPKSVTAFIGPSGCGKSTFPAHAQPHARGDPGCRVEGEVLLDGDDLYGPGVDPVASRT